MFLFFGIYKFPINQNMDPGDPNILGGQTFPTTFEENRKTTEEDIWDNDLEQEEEMKVEVRKDIFCQIIVYIMVYTGGGD